MREKVKKKKRKKNRRTHLKDQNKTFQIKDVLWDSTQKDSKDFSETLKEDGDHSVFFEVHLAKHFK